jgi:hypothetical protein
MTDWSEERPTIELVKQTVTVAEVAELLGFEPDSSGKITSPWNPDERTPSCHLYEDHFHDFSTGKHGDVIDLVRAFNPDLTVPEAVRKVWLRALRCGKEPGDVERQPVRQVVDFSAELYEYNDDKFIRCSPSDPGVINTPFEDLNPPAGCRWDYLRDELLIPHADQDGVYGVKVRHADDTKSSWPGSQFTKRLYDPHGWAVNDGLFRDVCVITEGESDCWALQAALSDPELGGAVPTVLALPSGAASWKDAWLEDLEPFEKVYLCMDNDRAGQAARDKLTRKIGWLKAEQLRVPGLYNDAREAITAGWKPTL